MHRLNRIASLNQTVLFTINNINKPVTNNVEIQPVALDKFLNSRINKIFIKNPNNLTLSKN
jgi:hypothetical protein